MTATNKTQNATEEFTKEFTKEFTWLSVVGIGEEGFEVLLPEARMLCEGARHILGAPRHIASLPQNLQARAEAWLSPFRENLTKLDALQKTTQTTSAPSASIVPPVCVLATGDPLSYGVGATLLRRYGKTLRIVPWRGSFSLAAAAMGWAHDSFSTLSLHGRPLGLLQRSLAPCARLLVMLSGASDTQRIAELLCAENLEASAMTILSKLGGSDESIVRSTAMRLRGGLAQDERSDIFSDLAILALELPANPSEQVSASPRVFGQRLALPDEAFAHDGQLTKRHARALTLAALVVQRDALLWDLGAGAGSVAIEWCLAGGRACAVERDARRVALIEKNRARFALEDRLEIVHATAQEFVQKFVLRVAESQAKKKEVATHSPPQAIFVGGGLDKALLEQLLSLLAPHGRFVANAVSLAGEGVLLEAYRQHGGELVRIAIAQVRPLGETQAFSPQRCVMQYVRRA